jgi:lipoprotein-anchoring transpeptidase ErfK/SrfK
MAVAAMRIMSPTTIVRSRKTGVRNMRIHKVLLGLTLLTGSAGISAPQAAPQMSVGAEAAGTIIVRTGQRRLYYVVAPGRTISYPVGVGRAGKQWAGETYIASKQLKPAWSPPAEIRHDKPSLPAVIPAGARNNPMGAAALVLAQGEYAIHGTNAPSSIGGFVSYGCIRMYNKDILDLYQRVSIGTRVVVSR